MSGEQIGDLLIRLATIVSQILIGWLYFRNWRNRLLRAQSALMTTILVALWVLVAANMVENGTRYRGRQMSPEWRAIVEGGGMIWSAGTVASLMIYFGIRQLSRRFPVKFSEERRGVIKATGVAAIAAPFPSVPPSGGGVFSRYAAASAATQAVSSASSAAFPFPFLAGAPSVFQAAPLFPGAAVSANAAASSFLNSLAPASFNVSPSRHPVLRGTNASPPHHRHLPPPPRDVDTIRATPDVGAALSRAAVAAMAGPPSALTPVQFSVAPSLADSTLSLSSPPRTRGWQAMTDPLALFSPVYDRNAFVTPMPPPEPRSTVHPHPFVPAAHVMAGPASPTASAHPPLRPRADEGARNVENARGVAAGGGAPDSSAATIGTFQFPRVVPLSSFSGSGLASNAVSGSGVATLPQAPAGSVFGFDPYLRSSSELCASASGGRDVFGNSAAVNFLNGIPAAFPNTRRVPFTPPPPARPSMPPTSSVFVRARAFRARAVQACAALNRHEMVGAASELCGAIDAEVQERMNSVPPAQFEQAWGQAGVELSAALVEATGSTPSAVADSLNASEGDPSISLLDLLHSKGNSFIESCAAEASVQLQEDRRSRSFRRFMSSYFPDVDPNSEEALRVLQDNVTPEAMYRLLGHGYRPGSRQPLSSYPSANLPLNANPDQRRVDGHHGPQDAACSPGRPEQDDEEEEEEGSDDPEEDEGDSEGAESVGDKRKSKKSNDNEGEGRGLRMIRDPMKWVDGTPPTGGFELETFQAVYDDWLSVVSGLEKGCGCTFKSRIDHKLIPGIRGNLRLTPKEWKEIGDEALISKISKKLNFNHSDYYHSQFEVISMPYPPPDPMCITSDSVIATDYKMMTNRMLYILDQARTNGVTFRWSNVKKSYKKAIRGYVRLERLSDRRDFDSLDAIVSYTNKKLKKRITLDKQKQHESEVQGRVAGVRSDVNGGKSEPSEATPPRGRGGRGQLRGRGRGSFGGRGGFSDRAGIQKKDSGQAKGSKDEVSAKRMSQAYAKEDTLPRGRYWHKRTPFCPAEGACSAKFCQGCGYHGTPGNWHDRPKCRTCKHPDFVQDGYFHDKHPDKLNLFTDKSASLRMMMGETTAVATPTSPAHLRGVSGGADGGSCQHCHPSPGNRSHTI